MGKRKQKLDIDALRAAVYARTDIIPADRKFDGRRADTLRCTKCAGSGLLQERQCTVCSGYGVVLTWAATVDRARSRRWLELRAAAIAHLGITESEFDAAEEDAERAMEKILEAERKTEEREDESEARAEGTSELRFDRDGRVIVTKSRRHRRRDA